MSRQIPYASLAGLGTNVFQDLGLFISQGFYIKMSVLIQES
jgi:hypothetical protein